MPAYHSQYNEGDYNQLGNMSLLPLNTNVRGPAPPTDTSDIIDEAIELFRANCLFKNYEIKGGADRVLIYVTLFISEILTTIQTASNKSASEATKILNNLALERFTVPGDPNFPLNSMYHPPENRNEAGNFIYR
jgi:actin related protein 2/3 complex subunit 3